MSQHQLARGSIYLISGHVIFYLSSYIIHFGLTRYFSPTDYGTIGVIFSILTILQLFLMNGIPTAAAKYLSEDIDGNEVRLKSLFLQSLFAFSIACLVFITAPLIADLLNDNSFIPYIRFLSIVIIIRAINELFGRFFNGYREFKKQAIHIALDSVPKIIFVFIFVYMGCQIYGVFLGYATASLIGIIYGIIYFKPERVDKLISYRQIVNFSYPIIMYSIFYQLITALDLFFIKASNISEEYVGFYTSARVLSTMFTIVSATFSLTLFPSISKSFSSDNKKNTDSYIKTSLRFILLLFIPAAVIISTNSKELLSLFFTSQYAAASTALSILIWGWFFLQLFYVFASIINASGKSKIPAFITGTAVIVAWFCNHYMVNRYGMEGGATATLITGLFCFICGFYFVHRIFKVSLYFYSTVKIVTASLIILLFSLSIHVEGILVVGWCAVLFGIYLGILFLIKEINNEDLIMVHDIFRGFVNNGTR